MALALQSVKPDKIPIDQAIKLRYHNNLTYQEIATKFGATRQAVQEKIKNFKALIDEPAEIHSFKDNRADIFAAVQWQIISTLASLDRAEQKDLMLRQPSAMALWFNSLFNNERLERGQSTVINGYSVMDDKDLDSTIKAKIQAASRLGIRVTEMVVD